MLDLDADQDRELSLVELAVGQWVYWMQFADTNSDTHQKILLPLDRTKEAERVLSQATKLLRSEEEGILLHVIQTNHEAPKLGDPVPRGIDRHDRDRTEAMEYLIELTDRLGADSHRRRCDVIQAASIVDGVVSYATREGVDIIVMNDQQRKGLAKLARRSIAKEIERKTPIGVRIFRTSELALR